MDSAFASLAFALLQQEREGLPGWVIQALLVFFFLVLPIVRGIRETLAKKKELESRRADRSAPAADSGEVDEMEEARRRFEALVRGETPPPRQASPVAPPPVPRPTAADAPTPMPLSAPLSTLAPVPSEDEAEAAASPETADTEHFVVDEETRARAEHDRRIDEEREARSDFLRREREAGAGRRAGVAAESMTSIGETAPAMTVESASRPRPEILFPAESDPAARRVALRRAIVASELLGSPAALRDPATGPLGLRRTA